MKRPPIRIVDIAGSPEAIGFEHGRRFADSIRGYLDDRVGIIEAGAWTGSPMARADALDLAATCLDAHAGFSPARYAEMEALADGAGISAAEAVIVGGFTDFVDVVRAAAGTAATPTPTEDDCTAVVVPAARAGGRALLAQTWDMHDSATDHVVLLRIVPDDGPAAAVFTTFGCLGQLGINEAGLCVGVNNLSATTGRPGVTWPLVVRALLACTTAAEALEVLRDADLAGAHNYLVLDSAGDGWSVEAMPGARPVATLGDEPLVHTNHTLDPAASAEQTPRSGPLQESSERRLVAAREFLAARATVTPDDLKEMTQLTGIICLDPAPPLGIETSGAAVIRPATGELWAVWGRPAENDYVTVDAPAHG